MPLAPGAGRDAISCNVAEMIGSGWPRAQAVAASLDNARRHPRAYGGPANQTPQSGGLGLQRPIWGSMQAGAGASPWGGPPPGWTGQGGGYGQGIYGNLFGQAGGLVSGGPTGAAPASGAPNIDTIPQGHQMPPGFLASLGAPGNAGMPPWMANRQRWAPAGANPPALPAPQPSASASPLPAPAPAASPTSPPPSAAADMQAQVTSAMTGMQNAMGGFDNAYGVALNAAGGDPNDPAMAPFAQGQHDAFMGLVNAYRTKSQLGMARGGGLNVPRFADGGNLMPAYDFSRALRNAGESPASTPSGLLHSEVAGRTDRLPLSVAAGSYVLPADLVSGLGEGNTLAGSRVLDKMFGTAPMGTNLPHGGGRTNFPRPPAPERPVPTVTLARGGHPITGRITKPVEILAAGGEWIVDPEAVRRLGAGDLDHGHDILDRFVVAERKKLAKKLQKLPGPKDD